MKCKKWIYAEAFSGYPQTSNFRLEEEDLNSDLEDGDVLLEAVYLSVDPYMRIFPEAVGDRMVGEQIARIVKSKNDSFPAETYVLAHAGWRTHTVLSRAEANRMIRVADVGNIPRSLALGIMGMPGMTAYFGLLSGCKPKPGETVYVNTAAGAVGSVVGQIAKIKGCKVVGSAGTDEKCRWIKEELGFDVVFNYKKDDLETVLSNHVKQGVDCFFDNVGNDKEIHTILSHMNKHGRMAICGVICQFNEPSNQTGLLPYHLIMLKSLKVEGISGWNNYDRWEEGKTEMLKWIQEGKVKYRETVTEGFENMASAFIGLFSGQNIGKAIVKI